MKQQPLGNWTGKCALFTLTLLTFFWCQVGTKWHHHSQITCSKACQHKLKFGLQLDDHGWKITIQPGVHALTVPFIITWWVSQGQWEARLGSFWTCGLKTNRVRHSEQRVLSLAMSRWETLHWVPQWQSLSEVWLWLAGKSRLGTSRQRTKMPISEVWVHWSELVRARGSALG